MVNGFDAKAVTLSVAFMTGRKYASANKESFIGKWQERLRSDNVLVRYKALQFMGIMADAEVIEEFDAELYFALVEKMTVYDGGRVGVSLLDGTNVEFN